MGSRTVKSHTQKKIYKLIKFWNERIHRSTIKWTEEISTIFLRCIWRQSASKTFGVRIAYSCKTDVFIEFHHFKKKRWWNSFFWTSLFKNRSSSPQETTLNIYEILKLLPYNHHQYNQHIFYINHLKNVKPSNHHS